MKSSLSQPDPNMTDNNVKTIFGVQIMSKDVLVGLIEKIKAGGFDNEKSRLTPVEREASHALIVDLARGFDYLNLYSDDSTLSLGDEGINVIELFGVLLKTLVDIDDFTKYIELGKYEVWLKLTSKKRKEVMDTICAMWDSLVAENKSGSLENMVKSLTMGVPLIKGSGFTIETVTIEYEWKPPRCNLCKIFGHVHDHCPKKVSIPPTVVTPNVATPTVEKTTDGFHTVGKKKKKGKSKSTNGGQVGGHSVKQTVRYEPKATISAPKKGATNSGNASKSSSMLKNQPLKATFTSTKEGNITMSNSYAALDDESDKRC
ncbi:hypothetical protein Tco_0459713 [Tanacetum coccineum]